MTKPKGAICVVAYNRINAIVRMLDKIYSSDLGDLPVYVSIDYSEKQTEIVSILESKAYYNKINIICHNVNLGLKKHVLFCGDIIREYDYLVVLEDDLLISSYIIDYVEECLKTSLHKVATISLYSYHRSEGDLCSFIPIASGYDNYYMQFPSSWGQVYTKPMWFGFREWLDRNDCEMFNDDLVPEYICRWPASSWKKHFLRYMIHNDLYSIYPYFSLTSNPGEDGTHHKDVGNKWVSNILQSNRRWDIKPLEQSDVIYNCHFLPGLETKSYTIRNIRMRRAEDSGFIHIDYLSLFFSSIKEYLLKRFTK